MSGMTLGKLALLSTALCSFLSDPAAAADGWYMGLGAGLTLPSDLEFSGNPNITAGTTAYAPDRAKLDYSGRVLVTAGYGWNNNLRLEGEFGYSGPSISSFQAGGQSIAVTGADLSEVTLFGNAVYDLPLSEKFSFSVGGGLGVGITSLDTGSSSANATGFAFQTISGFAYHWTSSVDIAFDYRYVRINGLRYLGGKTDAASHNLMLSLRWFFNSPAEPKAAPAIAFVPPPPPIPQMPPPPVKTYIVFFDFNKSYLTDAAQSVVAEAVKAAKTNGMVKVEIAGHTDTVGPDDYNMKLSLARASSVKDEMIRQGMDGTSIGVEGKGYHDPLISTGPGVREPQNRRAVIDLGT